MSNNAPTSSDCLDTIPSLFQCFRGFQEMTCGANCGANEKSSCKKVDKNLFVTA